jgi:beta-glucanase (GH16 family)
MKYLFLSFAAIISFHALGSCSKDSGGDAPAEMPPKNIVINAVVSSDGSGKVDFTTTAENAVSYTYEFGNGATEVSPSGATTYFYTTTGTINYNVKVTAKASNGLTASATKAITVTKSSTYTNLVWSDEFNTAGAPDGTKWGYDIGTGSGGWGNQELQYYTDRPENVICDGGVLKIKAIKEAYQGSAYTSARLLTKGKYEFRYGRVEIRAKVPATVGTWPAAWTLGADISTVGWPACGEADILEHRGSDLNKIVAALHYPGRSGGNADVGTTTIQNASTEFHIYSFEWTASTLQFFVDGRLFHSAVSTGTMPYQKNHFLLLNLAIGGSFGGAVDPAFTTATYEVDYVRVYN